MQNLPTGKPRLIEWALLVLAIGVILLVYFALLGPIISPITS
jgi:hypothetical protein